MSGLNSVTRLILRLANRIAGPERREWVLAMAAEVDAADEHGVGWALGCLGAAVKDRTVRDRRFFLALATLPALVLVLLVPLSMIVDIVARKLGLPRLSLVPLMLLGPLPVAWLLGRLRPTYSPLLVGTLAFLVHQSVPLIAMWRLTGKPPVDFWSPNVTYYMLPASAGLFLSWLGWVGAAGLGGVTGRRPPSISQPASSE